ncbi:uncharacterized protein LOC124156649 [Ischnura elegans]|uniref:uncharacterized protein LOC124156649 n=1 Tax=Ischnura elegans TaxID=197161 RepID=UPI001ED8822B|nr:uncharacterized protein LOC124156649 [Ischnura elegans]
MYLNLLQQWVVVEFMDTNECKAIPTLWLSSSKEECRFPPESISARELLFNIKACMPANEGWPQYKIRHFSQSVTGDYSVAIQLELDAVDTSDVDAGRPLGRGRRKKKPIIFESDEDDGTKILAPTKRNRIVRCVSDDSSPERCERQISRESPPKFIPTPRASQREPSILRSADVDISPAEESSLVKKKDLSQKSILEYLEKIEKSQQEIMKEIIYIKKCISQSRVEESEQYFDFKFPIKSEEDFDSLEVHLRDKRFQGALTKELVRRGGNNLTSGVFGMMYHIFTDDVGRLFSYLGNSKTGIKKRQFSTTLTCGCIFDAFRLKQTLATYSHKDVKEKIIDWLRHANSRHQRNEKKTMKEILICIIVAP